MLLGACVTNDRRHEGAPQRADFCDRNATHSGYYVSETIAEICRCGGATHASHGWPWKATQGLRGAGTAQRNAAVGASLVRQAPGGYPRKNALICAANAGGAASNRSSP